MGIDLFLEEWHFLTDFAGYRAASKTLTISMKKIKERKPR